jgi:hypothetical protein
MRLVTTNPKTVSPRCSYLDSKRGLVNGPMRERDTGRSRKEDRQMDVPLVIRTQIIVTVLEDVRRPCMEATMCEDLAFNSPILDLWQSRPVDVVGPEIRSVRGMSDNVQMSRRVRRRNPQKFHSAKVDSDLFEGLFRGGFYVNFLFFCFFGDFLF